MSNVQPRDLTHSDKPDEFDGDTRDPAREQNGVLHRRDDRGEQAFTLMRRVGLESMREIDRLIDGLNNLREKLENDGNRVQRDIADYASLARSVIEFTKIVSANVAHVKNVSDAPSIGVETLHSTVPNAIEREKETLSSTA
jgi:hypothetical protein